MHELAVADSLVEEILDRFGEARIARVVLEVGRLACIEPDAIRFCFEECARGTGLQGAALEIVDVPGRANCRGCGAAGVLLEGPIPLCACGSADLEVLAGSRLLLTGVEVA